MIFVVVQVYKQIQQLHLSPVINHIYSLSKFAVRSIEYQYSGSSTSTQAQVYQNSRPVSQNPNDFFHRFYCILYPLESISLLAQISTSTRASSTKLEGSLSLYAVEYGYLGLVLILHVYLQFCIFDFLKFVFVPLQYKKYSIAFQTLLR